MSQVAEIKGLNELLEKMRRFPVELAKVAAVGMAASLNTLWQNVPPYPRPPDNSTYRRTGTLGRSLGANGGEPSVYRIRQFGSGNVEGVFGTNLEYSSYVIGDTQQAKVHQGRWYTMKVIAEKSADKINQIWQSVGDKLAKFLESKGL